MVGRAFILYGLQSPGQERKFGCAVSRKTGRAVKRNQIKRRLREWYRAHRGLLPEDAHIVIVARPAAAALSFHESQRALRRLAQKGGLLRA